MEQIQTKGWGVVIKGRDFIPDFNLGDIKNLLHIHSSKKSAERFLKETRGSCRIAELNIREVGGKKVETTFVGIIGDLYGVTYLPSYMQDWPDEKAKIYCEVLNSIPDIRLRTRFESYLAKNNK